MQNEAVRKSVPRPARQAARRNRIKAHKRCLQLYILIAIPVILVIVFGYIPMAGNIIAFQDYSVRKGFLGSDFVGLKYFEQFLNLPIFFDIVRNTLILSLYGLVAGFPFPILLALGFNEIKSPRVKKVLADHHLRAVFHLHRRHRRHSAERVLLPLRHCQRGR